MAEKELLHDSLSEDESQPPPYTTQPKRTKTVQFSMSEGPRVKVQDASPNTIYVGLFATIFCCWPCGLVAVILGLQAMQAHYRGELHETRRKNTLAKRFAIASIVLGVIAIIAAVAVIFVEYFALMKLMNDKQLLNNIMSGMNGGDLPTDPVAIN